MTSSWWSVSKRFAVARARQLVEGRILEPDRERRDGARDLLAHEREHGRRVEAAGEEHADRHVAHEVASHRVGEEVAERLDAVANGELLGLARVLEPPVGVHLDAALVGHQQMARHHLLDALVAGERRGHVTEGQVVVEGLEVRLAIDVGGHQRLQLRREQQLVRIGTEVQRLDAQPVTPDDQAAPPRIPEGEGEHASQVGREVELVVLVQVENDLDVAARPEAVSAVLQRRRELTVVVDLAVADEPQRLVLVGDRLHAALEVDDREAAHPHGQRAARHHGAAVGPAVHERVAHGLDRPPRRGVGLAPVAPEREQVKSSGDSTHDLCSSLGVLQAARADRHPRRSHCTPWCRTSKAPASLRSKSASESSRARSSRASASGSLPAVTGPGRVATARR